MKKIICFHCLLKIAVDPRRRRRVAESICDATGRRLDGTLARLPRRLRLVGSWRRISRWNRRRRLEGNEDG